MFSMIKGMAVGAVMGACVTAVIFPQLDRRTQRNLKRAGKRALCMAENACDMMTRYVQ